MRKHVRVNVHCEARMLVISVMIAERYPFRLIILSLMQPSRRVSGFLTTTSKRKNPALTHPLTKLFPFWGKSKFGELVVCSAVVTNLVSVLAFLVMIKGSLDAEFSLPGFHPKQCNPAYHNARRRRCVFVFGGLSPPSFFSRVEAS
jgi:hypothetical protein